MMQSFPLFQKFSHWKCFLPEVATFSSIKMVKLVKMKWNSKNILVAHFSSSAFWSVPGKVYRFHLYRNFLWHRRRKKRSKKKDSEVSNGWPWIANPLRCSDPGISSDRTSIRFTEPSNRPWLMYVTRSSKVLGDFFYFHSIIESLKFLKAQDNVDCSTFRCENVKKGEKLILEWWILCPESRMHKDAWMWTEAESILTRIPFGSANTWNWKLNGSVPAQNRNEYASQGFHTAIRVSL